MKNIKNNYQIKKDINKIKDKESILKLITQYSKLKAFTILSKGHEKFFLLCLLLLFIFNIHCKTITYFNYIIITYIIPSNILSASDTKQARSN